MIIEVKVATVSMPFFIACSFVVECVDKRAVASCADIITFKTCWSESAPDWPRSECGVLQVPEDYRKHGGQQVELPFVIFNAHAGNRNTHPLVVAGGVPVAAVEISDAAWQADTLLWTSRSRSTVDAGRDLILLGPQAPAGKQGVDLSQ